MTIDKQALREAAEKATPGNWRRASSLFNGITVTPFSLCGEEVTLAHTVEKRDAEFIAAANPATVLALLDENIKLQREKDAIEAVAPAPVVPEEMPAGLAGQIVSLLAHNIGDKLLAQKIWNACRATMLNGGKS
ncbi:ead/Ea22-like family protein [Salmonella enterica subsp. indica]|nr:ead/Ea22-like family protein [Salmonella enterica]